MPKPLIVVIAVVVALFVGVAFVGQGREWSSNPDDNAWAKAFRFGGAPTIGPDDMAPVPGCFDTASATFVLDSTTTTCIVDLRSSDDRARIVTLRAVSGRFEVTLDTPFPEDVEVEEVRVDPGKEFSGAVGRDGGSMRVVCRSTACRVELGS